MESKHEQQNNGSGMEELREEIQKINQKILALERGPRPYFLHGAIILAGAFVGMGLFMGGGNTADTAAAVGGTDDDIYNAAMDLAEIKKDDHIRGDFDAPIKIVEFSDYDCPFCAAFHDTMRDAMAEFGPDGTGEIAWVYRHFPLEMIHPDARGKANAAECVAALGGDDAFWKFTDRLLKNPVDLSALASIAAESGVPSGPFEECLNEKKYDTDVQEDIDDGFASGIRGTPHSIIIAPNGNKAVISGAQPYDLVRDYIESAREQK
ncbi:DsbA family protein [bacterium]|nr:DsbA family protein [bacterium]